MLSEMDTKVVVPSDEDRRALEALLASFQQAGDTTFEQYLPGHNSTEASLKLPEALVRVLIQAARELARGHAVAVVSLNEDLTTQAAADILNVSRPYLITLLERGDIPFVKTGTHRRIRLDDLMAYKRIRDAERRRGLARLTQMSQEMGLYDE